MIIIPMAGLSSRFFKAGYKKPKYMLELFSRPLFDYCLLSFKKYFDCEHFIFVVRDTHNTVEFVNERIQAIGIKSFSIKILSHETRGQAETVLYGISDFNDTSQPITIFNIDTIRPDFSYPIFDLKTASYLEVFQGDGDNWSFVKPLNESSNMVALTSEKRKISNLCCTGLYHFASIDEFKLAYNHYILLPKEQWDAGELYVAPMYNYLIGKGHCVKYDVIGNNNVIFCGTPDEYHQLLANKKEPIDSF